MGSASQTIPFFLTQGMKFFDSSLLGPAVKAENRVLAHLSHRPPLFKKNRFFFIFRIAGCGVWV